LMTSVMQSRYYGTGGISKQLFDRWSNRASYPLKLAGAAG